MYMCQIHTCIPAPILVSTSTVKAHLNEKNLVI